VTVLLPGAGKQVQPSPEAQDAGMSPLNGDLALLAWEVDTVTPYGSKINLRKKSAFQTGDGVTGKTPQV
jgi:hypothetical protein